MSNKNNDCNFINMLKENPSLVMGGSLKHMIPSNEISQKVIKTLEKELMDFYKNNLSFMDQYLKLETIEVVVQSKDDEYPATYVIFKGENTIKILLNHINMWREYDLIYYKEYAMIHYMVYSIRRNSSMNKSILMIQEVLDNCKNKFIKCEFMETMLKILLSDTNDDTTIKELLTTQE